MFITVYIHGSKESMRDKGETAGLRGNALNFFMYACYEVKIGLEVDDKGNAKIISIDDRFIS